MRWRRSAQTQIEDRRGDASGGVFGPSTSGLGSGGMGIPIPVGGGIGGIIVFIIILVLSGALNGLGGSGSGSGSLPGGGGAFQSLDPNDDPGQFVNAVTVDVQTFWAERFQQLGKTYPQTVTVLFTGQTQSGCGIASSATGPFYCPADEKVYLDTAFFDQLASQFGAPGEFAQAYVIAHEFGHHVQDALGVMDQVAAEQQSNSANANDLSIRLELQADCLAGVWANSVWAQPDQANVESITEADIQGGIKAAEAVGDDRIQEQATGTIDKESWTHGSSEQRVRWFQTGFQQGTVDGCDTFAVAQP
ncbi:MAG: neutral zinc metallopeptidase [Chloroflexota bacterium]